jgi:hypothetical protein
MTDVTGKLCFVVINCLKIGTVHCAFGSDIELNMCT